MGLFGNGKSFSNIAELCFKSSVLNKDEDVDDVALVSSSHETQFMA